MDIYKNTSNGMTMALDFISNGDGTFTQGKVSTVGGFLDGGNQTYFAININGRQDIMDIYKDSSTGNTMALDFMNNGDGTFTQGKASTVGGFLGLQNQTYFAVNINGRQDIMDIYKDSSTGKTMALDFTNNGDGTFTKGKVSTLDIFLGASNQNYFAININGRQDIMDIWKNSSTGINMATDFINNGDGTFTQGNTSIAGGYIGGPTTQTYFAI